MTTSLGEALPQEIKRVSELRDLYLSLSGGVGTFGAALMQDALTRATQALAEGDVVAIMRSYEELKDYSK